MSNPTTFLAYYAPIFRGASFVGIVTGVTKGFEWADGGVSAAGRIKLSRWLKNVPGDEQIDTWVNIFPKLIDHVFGPKALSWRFFLRSCVATLLAVFVALGLSILSYGLSQIDSDFGAISGTVIPIALIFALIANCLPDYISVLVSRFVVRQMTKNAAGWRIGLLLIFDTCSTLTFAYLSMFVIELLAGLILGFGFSLSLRETLNVEFHQIVPTFRNTFQAAIDSPSVRSFFFASLFTSIWVWLYVLASVAIRIAHRVRFVWIKLLPFLSVDDKPMQAIGRVAGLMAGCGYLALLSGVWVIQHL